MLKANLWYNLVGCHGIKENEIVKNISISLIFIVTGTILFTNGCKKKSPHDPHVFELVSSCSVSELEKLINNGLDVNAKNERGRTLLHEVAMTGRDDVAAFLIDKGLDVNAKGNLGWTPLHSAAANSSWSSDVAYLLIAKGADINARTHDGATILHEAMIGGDVGLVKLLVEKGADVNAGNKAGSTPLHYALGLFNERDNESIRASIEFLLNAGADVMARDSYGDTVLEAALLQEDTIRFVVDDNGRKTKVFQTTLEKDYHKAIANLLASRVNFEKRDASGRLPLHYAIRKHNFKMVKILVENGADVNAKDGQGDTPLYVADYYIHNKEMVELLKEHGADYGGKAEPEPFIFNKEQFMQDIEQLVREGGDVDKGNQATGVKPLNIAVTFGHKKAVEFLLSNGANPDITDLSGFTALHSAVMEGRLEIARLLIDAGSNPNATGKNGFTVLHFAVMANSKNLQLAKLLIDAGADVNAIDNSAQTPLYNAVLYDDKEMVELLISNGANINAKDKDGDTPLGIAVLNDKTEIVELLRKHGAKE